MNQSRLAKMGVKNVNKLLVKLSDFVLVTLEHLKGDTIFGATTHQSVWKFHTDGDS